MNSPKLAELKKELNFQEPNDLKELCLRIAKYKTENKELLHYLLFYQNRKYDYVKEVKEVISGYFENLHPSIYYATKELRKATRVMNKYIKYIGEKDKEADLVLCYCENFIHHPVVNTMHKALVGLLFRQLKRVGKIILKLEDDLQFDYQQQLDELLKELKKSRPSFHLSEIN